MGGIHGRGPGERISEGDAVLAAAKSVSTTPVKARLAAFASVHRAYSAAETKVKSADAQVHAQHQKLGELDADQDHAIVELAASAAGQGLPRANPFKPFGFAAPSVLCKLGFADEAEKVQKLVAAIARNKQYASALKSKSKLASQTALAVIRADAALPKLISGRTTAMSQRDALAAGWEAAYAALKRGARAAADEGAPGLYAALFERAQKPQRAKKPTAPTTPAPLPTTTPSNGTASA